MRAVGVNKCWTHILLSLFLLCLPLIIPTSSATSSGNQTDHLALLAFKAKIFRDPQGAFSSWNMSLHFCNWDGIICSKQHKRVTSMNLSSLGLVGSLSPDIGNMSFLSRIILYNNSLQGVIPQEVGRLFRLKVLSLGRNALEGYIPNTLGQVNRLLILELASNKLSEHALGSMVSTKGDVYSYGMFLLEMLTGKKTTDSMFHEGFKLQNFVSNALSDGVKEIIDPVNLHELAREDAAQAEECLSILFNIGVKCALELPQFRPDISDILSVLKTVRIIFKVNTGSSMAYANKSSQAAVLMAQRNMKSLLSRKNMAPNSRSISMLPSVTVSYMDLHEATNGLSLTNLVGAGGFGSVYKGTFHQEYVRLLLRNSGIEEEIGTTVAIKVFNLQRRGAMKSFYTEYKTLRNIHHANLVKIIATCTSVDQEGHDFRAILYEYMDYGSLEMWLHPTKKTYHDGPIKPQILSLHARINIAIDIACALSYLHHQCMNCIIHCDLKPSNILLDKNMVARIADFGLAISLPESPNLNQRSSSIGLRGTTGYIAPEYGLGCMMTTKGDTYSFGILLLEMLTRKKPTHRMFRGGINLHNFVWMALPNHVIDITDPVMNVMAPGNEGDGKQVEECLTRMFNIGLACSKPSPKDRPDMRAVLHELKSIRNIL